ncbi:MAG: GtrA family protein [Erythrobacter sp.]|uniref:GtrA family protein n=1 Tax=Erythrobacter sp. TaxID=1042 RepID=UPI003C769C2F
MATSQRLRDQTTRRQLGRYTVIAAGSALLFNVILIGVHAAGVHYLAALAAAFCVVVMAAYCAHALFTFETQFTTRGFGRFVGTQLLGFPISAIVLATLIEGFGLAVWIATPIATILMFAYNFVSARWATLSTGNSVRCQRS